MIEGEEIVFLTTQKWGYLPTRKQIFAKRLAENNRVLYVEPDSNLLRPIITPGFNYESLFRLKLTRLGKNLYLKRQLGLLPFRYNPLVLRVNQFILVEIVRGLIRKVGFARPILWVYKPTSHYPLVRRISHKFVIYDCVDELSAYPGINMTSKSRVKKLVIKYEKELCEYADLVITTARSLQKVKGKYNKNTIFVTNGVNFEFFNRVSNRQFPVPEELKSIESPRLGFLGLIAKWTDLDLIIKLAGRHSNWNFVFVGPVQYSFGEIVKKINILKKKDNVIFVGYKPHNGILPYLQSFDICLNVFKENELTKYVNPIKFYEYMATGKPIVSTYMPELEVYKDDIYLSRDFAEFENNVQKAIAESKSKDKSKQVNRILIAKEYSWDNIFSYLEIELEKRLNL